METIKEPLPFQVNMWGSHPDGNNDDCFIGWDFATKKEALAKFEEERQGYYSAFVEVVGDDLYKVAKTKYVSDRYERDADEWKHEIAMEEGMLHGIDAYNEILGEVMGY